MNTPNWLSLLYRSYYCKEFFKGVELLNDSMQTKLQEKI